MENSSTSTAHTDGDWHIATPGNGVQKLILAGERLLAIVGDFQDSEPGEVEANARLMANAPEMLTDGQSLYDAIQGYLLGIADAELPGYLTEAFDRFDRTWNSARGQKDSPQSHA